MPEELATTANPKKLSAHEQIAMLRKELTGHGAFGRCRGDFAHVPWNNILKNTTPSATLRGFNTWAADRKILLNMLATLKRDGHMAAYEELWKALTSDHVIVGETVPLEKTEPGVLLIPDPEKVFLLARWLYTSRREDGQYWIKNGRHNPERGPCGTLTGKILETFPILSEIFQEGNKPFVQSPTGVVSERVFDIWDRLEKFSDDRIGIWVDRHKTDLWYWANIVGIFVRGKEQDEIFREAKITREEQKTIATWRFDYPAYLRREFYTIFSYPRMWIGFHPETEHEMWQRQWPSFISRGFSQGLGAIILDQEMCGQDHGNSLPVTPYTSLNGYYPQIYNDPGRIVLGFPSEQR